MATLRVGYCAGAAGRPGLSLAKLRLELGYATLAADPAGARVFDGRGFGASPSLPLLFEPLELCASRASCSSACSSRRSCPNWRSLMIMWSGSRQTGCGEVRCPSTSAIFSRSTEQRIELHGTVFAATQTGV